MDDKDLLTFKDNIDFLRFELNRYKSKNEDLAKQLKNAFKEIDTLKMFVKKLIHHEKNYF
jgi:FtsZ-binding cell division protein ZapB